MGGRGLSTGSQQGLALLTRVFPGGIMTAKGRNGLRDKENRPLQARDREVGPTQPTAQPPESRAAVTARWPHLNRHPLAGEQHAGPTGD